LFFYRGAKVLCLVNVSGAAAITADHSLLSNAESKGDFGAFYIV
jgi:hypothetical protein